MNYAIYASSFAFGSPSTSSGAAALYFCSYAVFPRSARKNRISRMEGTMLPQAEAAPNADERVNRVKE